MNLKDQPTGTNNPAMRREQTNDEPFEYYAKYSNFQIKVNRNGKV